MEKYKLPINSELYTSEPFDIHLENFILSKIEEKDQLLITIKDTSTPQSLRDQLVKQVAQIDNFIYQSEKEVGTGDPLVDLWEAQIEAGLDPDLTLTIQDIKNK